MAPDAARPTLASVSDVRSTSDASRERGRACRSSLRVLVQIDKVVALRGKMLWSQWVTSQASGPWGGGAMATSYRKKATKKTASKKTAKKAAPKKATKKAAKKATAKTPAAKKTTAKKTTAKKTAAKKTTAKKTAAKKTAAKKTASKRPPQEAAPVAAVTTSGEADGGGGAKAEASSGSSDSEEESGGDTEDDLADMSEETGPSELEVSRRLSADLDATDDADDDDDGSPAELMTAPGSGAPLDDDVLSRLGDDDDDLDD
ncbi:hypothetical protein [Nannocystis punicea]|uniref:Uncharacterized protein n=1 Tax=Nannocystis punicea TaxID=2995304 RepID=A0ABY7H3D6_9BACT|nr:hypothetical protein [Nannocystis poenicansa]WAS93780.1 hypothetical protein O0S08_47210 [Nannocystis poenicansa]